MKKLLLACLLFVQACLASADPVANGIQLFQRNAANDEFYEHWMVPTPGTPCVITMSASAPYFPSCVSASASTPAQSSASRSLNTPFQVSSTRLAHVKYAVQQTVTASIAGGQNGDVILEIASNSAFTTNVQTIDINGGGQTYTLAVALQGVQPLTTSVSGWVPAGYYVRIRTVSNTGMPAFLYRSGQELLY